MNDYWWKENEKGKNKGKDDTYGAREKEEVYKYMLDL